MIPKRQAALSTTFFMVCRRANRRPRRRQARSGNPANSVVPTRPVVQTVIAMAAPTSLPVNEHSVRADMLMSILAGGLQSRMYRSVRERLGAAYGVSAALNLANPAAYVLSIRSLVANDGARDALAAMSEDYARFVSGGVTSRRSMRSGPGARRTVRKRFADQGMSLRSC